MDRPVYDAIGRSYGATRKADARIVAELVRLVACEAGATVCDVGAGSGNYTNALADAGYRMLAVEPSATMRGQAHPHARVTWFEGRAEALPLADAASDAVVCTLAAHHFSDLEAALREMDRVCPDGPIVFFTADPRRGEAHWFSKYFPEICKRDFTIFPALEDFAAMVRTATGRKTDTIGFPLPADLADQCMEAHWSRPEKYLDPSIRANTSGFALADPARVEAGLAALARDLASGDWDREFGRFRTKARHDAGFCFLRFWR